MWPVLRLQGLQHDLAEAGPRAPSKMGGILLGLHTTVKKMTVNKSQYLVRASCVQKQKRSVQTCVNIPGVG